MEHPPVIDLAFPLTGEQIPLDHGYLLFSALARSLEVDDDHWLHEHKGLGIHPIRGRYAGPGRLALGERARLTLRLPEAEIPKWLGLAGRELQLAEDTLRIGIPQPRTLVPAPNLYAHRVTTRNGQDEARFDAEIACQLATLNVRGRPHRGPRRTFRVRGKRIVAYTLLVTELTAEESIRLQEGGLGGRRKLGCGIFLPWRSK